MRTSVLWRNVLASAVVLAGLTACGGGEQQEPPQAQTPSTAPTPATDDAAAPAGETTAPTETAAAGEDASTTSSDRSYELRKRLMDSTAAQEEWVPELVATPIDSVADTLRRADEARRAGRVEQGDNNALSLYLSIIEKEPDNADANKGVDEIVAELVSRGETALTQARFNEASRLAQVVAKVRPDNDAVKAFKAKVDAGREIGLLLGEAQRLATAGRLVEPEGENAAALYRDILRTDANNSAARQGLNKIESDLIAAADAAANQGNFAEAERLLADAGKAQPGSQAVQNAAARLVERRSSQLAGLISEANEAVTAKNLARADELLAQLEQLAANDDGVAQLRAQIESARAYSNLRPGQSLVDDLKSGGKGPEMVVLPLGSFTMGSPDNEPERKANEGPQRQVTLRQAIAMARAEVTVGEFRSFVTASGYLPTSAESRRSTIYDERSGSMVERPGVTWEFSHSGERATPNLPVVHVSWNDAKAYADWLAAETGQRYRLPSEAEFEYALRAGGQTRYPWGAGNPSGKVANVTGEDDRSASNRNWVNAFKDYGDGFWGSAPVRSFQPNAFGLHDMAGNVSEWVEDCWHENYQRAPSDGSAWVNPGCNRRVIRGASWASAPDQSRSAFRLTAGPGTTNARLGFRVAREL